MTTALLATLGGCGSEDAPSSDTRGSSAGSSGAAAGGMGGGGASAMAGSSSAGATAGAGAVGGGSCSGTFGKAYAVFAEDQGFRMNGISLTADELELYYSRTYSGMPTPSVVRRKRASKTEPFAAPEYLQELTSACRADQHVNQDVTDDGLTLYITCTDMVEIGLPEGVSTLRVAHRPDRNSAFTLQAEPAGGVFASAGISGDELTAYTDGEIYDTAPRMFTRASKTESFGEAEPVPGIDVPFNSPEISNDGLALFGSASPLAGSGHAIFRALRAEPNAPFQAPAQLDLQLVALTMGSPNITPSCTLYLIVAGPGASYIVYAAALQ